MGPNYGLIKSDMLSDLQEHYNDLYKSFEHVQNDLIARGAQYELSAIARDNGDFFIKEQAANRDLGDFTDI